ncbi:hypothetical protein DMENIID0001_018220 [Sergentomyia squamirostris]
MDSMDPSIASKSYCHVPSTPQSSGGEMVVAKAKGQQQQQLNSGNYINVVQMPVGVQYQQQQSQQQRRKYSPQVTSEYQ